MVRVLFVWLLAVNLLTYLVYWLDKRRAAKGGRRVSENELLGWALVGGSPAAFWAMRRLRHKTRKTSFKARLLVIVALQVACVVLLLRG